MPHLSKICNTLRRLLLSKPTNSDLLTEAKPIQVIKTLSELDQMLYRLDAAHKISDDELRKLFPTFRMEFSSHVPNDPYSHEYAQNQFDLYRKISGQLYSIDNEKSIFDLDKATISPFPYYTKSCETVGNHLTAIAHLIRNINLKPGAKIMEFGPGWGNTTLALAMMGFDVAAIDIEKNFCELIERRAKQMGVKINVINADFLFIEQVVEPVDAVLFFESFHHCSHHLRLIKGLYNAVKEDGKVYFASEPITSDFPIPWGIRLDGESLWAIRRNGWLELGFSENYFLTTLQKFGWIVEKYVTNSLPWATVYEARKMSN
jgi:cyclopropane fatty-acyl-phospholipid synthase-like methyltransferase